MKHQGTNPQPNSRRIDPRCHLVSVMSDRRDGILQRSLAVSRYQPGCLHAGRHSIAHSSKYAAVVSGEPSWLQVERGEAREQPGHQPSRNSLADLARQGQQDDIRHHRR